MPHDLASDPAKTVFEYAAIVSPPKDWDRWHDLVRDLVAAPGRPLRPRGPGRALVVRGVERGQPRGLLVRHARGVPPAVRRDRRRGPRGRRPAASSAARRRPPSGWVEELLAHAERSGSPVDFVIDPHLRHARRWTSGRCWSGYGREGTPIWWTEWGVTPTHFNEVSDAVFAGTFLLRGMASAMGRIEALSYWVVSDHFEELGRPPALLHGGLRDCAPSASCASRAGGRWRCSSGSRPTRLGRRADRRRGRFAGRGDRRSRRRPARSASWSGTSPSTRPRRPGPPTWPARSRSRCPGSSRGRRTSCTTTASTHDHSNIAAVWGRLQDAGPGLADRRAVVAAARRRPPRSPRPGRDPDRRRRGARRGRLRPPHARDVEPAVHAGLTGEVVVPCSPVGVSHGTTADDTVVSGITGTVWPRGHEAPKAPRVRP